MTILSDIKDQLRFISSDALGIGVAASYYPAVLEGYDETATERDPSESGPVRVRGYFGQILRRAPDGVMTTNTTFTLASTDDLSLVPRPFDRFTATRDGVLRSYSVTSVLPLAGGSTFAGYQLFVEQA